MEEFGCYKHSAPLETGGRMEALDATDIRLRWSREGNGGFGCYKGRRNLEYRLQTGFCQIQTKPGKGRYSNDATPTMLRQRGGAYLRGSERSTIFMKLAGGPIYPGT